VPAYLREASGVMSGRRVDAGVVAEVVDRAREEVTPISDGRVTAEYKRLLLGQLIKAHFLTLFPELEEGDVL
ncbi:MAG: hypothetical protein JST68_23670, partial [Bacteroidetes bacterium]|nr:hypothetical protein [Bacteroidota bacterium]